MAANPALEPLAVSRALTFAEDFIPHCMIQRGEGGPAIPFELWGFQREVLHEIEDNARIIILKARQLGLSWLTLAYMLWVCSANEGQHGLILNRGLRESKDLLDRVVFMHRRLPDELRVELRTANTEQLVFVNDSSIVSLPASEYAGSGATAQIVMLDEWAKIRGIRVILPSILPTLSAGGKLVGISTAVGYHNPFAHEWRRAVIGQSNYYPIFIPWDAHPDRDASWYEEKGREMATERDLRQEYPAEPREAFQLPGESVFRDEFDRQRHVIVNKRHVEAAWPLIRGIDFGYHHAITLWAEVQAERDLFVFAELHAQRMTTKQMMELVVARDFAESVVTDEVAAGVDPAGKAQTSVSTESDHYTVRAYGVRTLDAVVAPRERVTLIKQLLGEDRMRIHASCEGLIEAFEQAQWAKKNPPPESGETERIPGETYAKDGFYEHWLDALGYLVINVFPSHGLPAGLEATRGVSALRGPRYSSSEFG